MRYAGEITERDEERFCRFFKLVAALVQIACSTRFCPVFQLVGEVAGRVVACAKGIEENAWASPRPWASPRH